MQMQVIGLEQLAAKDQKISTRTISRFSETGIPAKGW
jgi:hypothetical protein